MARLGRRKLTTNLLLGCCFRISSAAEGAPFLPFTTILVFHSRLWWSGTNLVYEHDCRAKYPRTIKIMLRFFVKFAVSILICKCNRICYPAPPKNYCVNWLLKSTVGS